MRAAILARKSDDNPAGVEVQVALSRAFIESRGWTVADDCIFTDTGVSGGIFDRPGLNALMLALLSKPRPFDVLVMMDASRLGRDMAETLPLQLRIIRAGCAVWHYQDGQELKLDTPTQKLVASVANYSHEDFKYQIGLKTKAAKAHRAANGYATNAPPLGYRNEPSADGRYKRAVPDPEQTKIVCQIFTLAAEGKGLMKVAQTLNAARVPNPNGQERRGSKKAGAAWSSTSIRDILHRPAYIAEATRIVPQVLWDAAHRRIARTRIAYARTTTGQLRDKPESGLDSRYLLAGFLRCATCGGNLMVVVSHRKAATVPTYACATHRKRGKGACTMAGRLSMPTITESVVRHLRQVLTPERLSEYLERMVALAAQPEAGAERARVSDEITRLDAELARLGDALARGGSETVLGAIRTREAERLGLRTTLATLEATAATTFDPVAYRKEVGGVLKTWHRVLASDPTRGRRLLRACLDGPILVTHNANGSWSYTGALIWGRAFRGVLGIKDLDESSPSEPSSQAVGGVSALVRLTLTGIVDAETPPRSDVLASLESLGQNRPSVVPRPR